MKRLLNLLFFLLWISQANSQEKVKSISHYIFPEFTKGVVLMKSGSKYEALLNYNALSEEMIFEDKNTGKKLAILNEELERVDTIYINDRKFCTLNHKFVELIHHSGWDLFAEHKCNVDEPGKPAGYGGTSKTSAITSYSSLYANGVLYELKLPDDYKTAPFTWYWLKKNGQLNRIITMKQLTKLYDSKKESLNAYAKKEHTQFNNPDDICKLINYLETN